MAPKPMRLTVRSPPISIVPAAWAVVPAVMPYLPEDSERTPEPYPLCPQFRLMGTKPAPPSAARWPAHPGGLGRSTVSVRATWGRATCQAAPRRGPPVRSALRTPIAGRPSGERRRLGAQTGPPKPCPQSLSPGGPAAAQALPRPQRLDPWVQIPALGVPKGRGCRGRSVSNSDIACRHAEEAGTQGPSPFSPVASEHYRVGRSPT